jgi:hypothetical protein
VFCDDSRVLRGDSAERWVSHPTRCEQPAQLGTHGEFAALYAPPARTTLLIGHPESLIFSRPPKGTTVVLGSFSYLRNRQLPLFAQLVSLKLPH